jgi:hypothetical protein
MKHNSTNNNLQHKTDFWVRPEIRNKVRTLISAEADKMRAAGATDADLQEDAFAEIIGEKIAEQTFGELTPDDLRAVWQNFLETASPEELRHAAKNLRAQGESACLYDLEHLADLREREGA